MIAEGDDAEFAQLFELGASSRQLSAANAEVDALTAEGVDGLRSWLATQLEFSDEEVKSLSRVAEFLTDGARVKMQLMAEQVASTAPIMEAIDLGLPEHVGVFSAQVEILDALAVRARTTLAFLKTSHEIQRRIGGTAMTTDGSR